MSAQIFQLNQGMSLSGELVLRDGSMPANYMPQLNGKLIPHPTLPRRFFARGHWQYHVKRKTYCLIPNRAHASFLAWKRAQEIAILLLMP